MLSMSGFGSGSASGKGRRYHIECASINRKGLEIVVTLPRGLTPLEPQIREEIQKKIARGRLHISLTDELLQPISNSTALINTPAAQHTLKELQKLQKNLKLTSAITLEMILRVPGVLCDASVEPVNLSAAWKPISIALQKALQSLLSMKMKEGKNLVRDLKKHFSFLEQSTKKIKARVPNVLNYRRDQIQARLAALNIPLSNSDPSLLRELALFAEKSDISEEIIRLESHLSQSQELLIDTTTGARTLDYLAQEMFREFNTLSNKANDAEISHHVVHSKSALDKIREQLANLE